MSTLSDNDVATSCKNLVKFDPITQVIMLLIFVPSRSVGKNQPTDLYSSCWHSKTRWTIGVTLGTLKVAMIHVRMIQIW